MVNHKMTSSTFSGKNWVDIFLELCVLKFRDSNRCRGRERERQREAERRGREREGGREKRRTETTLDKVQEQRFSTRAACALLLGRILPKVVNQVLRSLPFIRPLVCDARIILSSEP